MLVSRRNSTRTALLLVAAGLAVTACSSSGSSSPSGQSTQKTVIDAGKPSITSAASRVDSGGTSGFGNVDGAVAIEYDESKIDDPRPLKETPVTLKAPSKQLTVDISKITYSGIVCGFTFTGEQPPSPISITMSVEQSDGTVASGKVPMEWTGTEDKTGGASDTGWDFLGDAQANRLGPGWVVQVGAIPKGGGQGVTPPKRARCVLDSANEIPVASGPVNIWAGFATK